MSKSDDAFQEFNEYYEKTSAPYRDMAATADNQAITFAVLLVESAALLNGGALVAVPTFLAAIGISFSAHQKPILTLGALFVIGLVAAIVSAILGYVALVARYNEGQTMATAALSRADAHVNFLNKRLEAAQKSDNEAKEIEKKAIPHRQRFHSYRFAGLMVLLASFIVFVAAVLCSVYVIAIGMPVS